MATLAEFLRTGHLGPVILGMTPADVITLVGDPDQTSRKSNPLHLKYGAAEFFFWQTPHEPGHVLRKIAVFFAPKFEKLPTPIAFTDWVRSKAPSEREFKAFIKKMGYLPVQQVKGPDSSRLLFLSGVAVFIADGVVHSVRVDAHERRLAATPLGDQREPKVDEILAMFEEADRASRAGADRAALLIAWAGLEAALRYRTLRIRPTGKVRIQPANLIRELFSAAELDSSEHKTLEEIRQLRSSVAHGLTPVKFNSRTIEQMRQVALRLLGPAIS